MNEIDILDKCPVCGKDIIISYKQTDFACSDINCPLGHGAGSILLAMKDGNRDWNVILKIRNRCRLSL